MNKSKQAFSLTELLIVLVIISVLFAAMLPIMTKRRNGDTTANEPVWIFVSNDDQKDAFYDPGVGAYTSTAFIGLNPEDLSNNYVPYSKVVIKAKQYQDLIQFRYGSSNGVFVGKFFMDDKGNIYNTSRLSGTKATNYNVTLHTENTVLGNSAFSKVLTSFYNTAVGFNSMAGSSSDVSVENVAVGVNTAQYIDNATARNTFVGANTGRGKDTGISSTVALGSGILGLDESYGAHNTFAGYYVASIGFDAAASGYNTLLGSSYYGKNTSGNTLIGTDTYPAGSVNHNAKNITAVGSYSCDSMLKSPYSSSEPGSRTCIGYSSGASSANTPESFERDRYDHVFLGGNPKGFGGRSVLEVHNIDSKASSNLKAKPNMGPTVVMNSNLVVRGNFYFPDAQNGILRAPTRMPVMNGGSEQNRDWCSKGCCFRLWRRYKCYEWRKENGCNIIADIFSAILSPLNFVINKITGIWTPTTWITDQFKASNDDKTRSIDPRTASALTIVNTDDSRCDKSSVKACPDLKTSDIRLKDNINVNDDALNLILNVIPYNYTFKADKKNIAQVGVIAQDLQKYSPVSVSSDDEHYLNIRWDEMFYALINSVKNLDNKLEAVTSDLNLIDEDANMLLVKQKDTKYRINQLNKRLNKLEK